MWQDFVFTIGLIVFDLALIPAILLKHKPPLITSSPTALIQLVFACTFVTLGLWFSAVASLINGTLWGVLAIQEWKKQQKVQKPTKR